MPDEGLEDLADMEVTQPPVGWVIEEDTKEFSARDKDEDADG